VPKAADLKKDEDEIRKEKRKSDAAKAPAIEIKEAAKSKFLDINPPQTLTHFTFSSFNSY
jgi:hypothetical protein